jgi:hypothetical protein
LPNCSLLAQNFRHVPVGDNVIAQTQSRIGKGLWLKKKPAWFHIAYSIPRDNGQEQQPKTKGPKVTRFTA